jgi:hypothetical protein
VAGSTSDSLGKNGGSQPNLSLDADSSPLGCFVNDVVSTHEFLLTDATLDARCGEGSA